MFESKLFCIDGEDENEVEEETSQHSAPPSNEGPTHGYSELELVLGFPESVQRAWIGTAEYYTSTQAYLEKVVECLEYSILQDAIGYNDKLSKMLRILEKSRG